MMMNDCNTPEIKRSINNLRGKHIKQLLERLELSGDISNITRKAVLDELNDLTRAILHTLGYIEEH